MYSLTKILVYIPDATDSADRAERAESILAFADDGLQCEASLIFEWWKTDENDPEFPEPVVFAEDNVDYFIDLLETIRTRQRNSLECTKRELKRYNIRSIDNLSLDCSELIGDYLKTIGELTNGSLNVVAGFYNLDRYTSKIYDYDIEAIKKNPKDWALVIFNCHS